MTGRIRLPIVAIVLQALGCLSIAGCGGAADPAPEPADPPPVEGKPPGDQPPPMQGIGRTGRAIASGAITGFGSIIVNGVKYETDSSTSYLKDGEPSRQDELAVGHVVFIYGTINKDKVSGHAELVVFDDNVEGPVQAVDELAGSLVVMGQTVYIGDETSIDHACPPNLSDYPNEPAVEISGSVRADGSIEATRIECRDNLPSRFEVTGMVSDPDSASSTFKVNELVIDYSEAGIDGFPRGKISAGDLVEVRGRNELGPADELVATRVEFKGDQFAEYEGDHAEIEGLITRFVSEKNFDVAGIPVKTTRKTEFDEGQATDLGLNVKIEVEGEFDKNGVLVAEEIEIEISQHANVTGTIDEVSGSAITVLGIPINTDRLKTRFEDLSDADVDPLAVGDLHANDYIKVRGQELPPGEITAFFVERDDPDTETSIRGFVEKNGVNRPALIVLGVTIETNSQTVFRDTEGAPFPSVNAFWNAVGEGSLISVDGTGVAGTRTIIAEEVELVTE